MRSVLLALVSTALLSEGTGHAAPGTFLILEGGLSYGMGEAFPEAPSGYATELTIGAGGKPKGWPLRFYGILNLGWGSYEADVAGAVERATIRRETFSWAAGLRIVAPIKYRLRFFAESTLGGYTVGSDATLGGGVERIASDDASFLVNLGMGLQWRFNLWFSLGARVDLQIPTGLDAFDPLAEAAGVRSSDAGFSNVGLGLTATFHL